MAETRRETRLMRTGIIGAAVAALCCFTPVLVVPLGALGLSAMLGWIDVVLLPALAIFLGLIVLALRQRHRRVTHAGSRVG